VHEQQKVRMAATRAVRALRCFLRPSLTEAPSLHRHCPVSSVLRASPSPHRARPGSRELPVDRRAITAGASRVASGHLRLHAVARTPAGLIGLVRSCCPINSGLPSITSGSAPASLVSRLAQRSPTVVTACMLAKSPNVTLYTGGSDGFVTSTAAPIATGWSEPVPGWSR